ncbi:fatty acid desaturase [Solimonas marina]|uniref:Alkane 1-monooxygenase n=1 Tax=Solimonas marina TaxID=2714601 RepID=A0A970B7H0_9GAMM|nr:fatty acid desaturase [Solimonas marina]NKF21189.1 alkane 1-monooxygenase [Solimonas marina]
MSTTTLTTPPSSWRDGKRYLWLLSPLVPVLSLSFLLLVYATGNAVFFWGMPLIIYGLLPLLDTLIGADPTNPPDTVVADLERDRYYRAIVFAYIPAQFAATIFGTWLVATGGYSWWALIGAVWSVGIINGVAINTAHELGHKTDPLERWFARLTLAPVAYGHFFIEHNKGHHKNVATPDDPASSRMGESFWAFLPRTMIGSLRSAWRIEAGRLARNGKPAWSLANENLQSWAMTAVLFGALTVWLGPVALLFLAVQAFVGASLLEVVNYIEHYGLLRRYNERTKRYERCAPRHSWNSNHIVTNLFLYQLQRHSDHHANPTRRYQALRHFDESPQLPSGYMSMILVAYLPPLWFRLMDERVAGHHRGDLRQANLHPPKREALLARWQTAATPAPAPATGTDAQPADVAATADAVRHGCPNCGYVYDETIGCAHEGIAPGTPWARLPADWPCPNCAVREKIDFRPLSVGERIAA